jgi:hypothetical protein
MVKSVVKKKSKERDSEEERKLEILKSDISCAICLSITEKPCMPPCGHLFCDSCLTEWMSLNSEPNCPKCRNPFGFGAITHINNGFSSKIKNNIRKKILKPGFSCQNMKYANLLISKTEHRKPSFMSIFITTILCLLLMISAEWLTSKLMR